MRGLFEFEFEGQQRGFLINFAAFGIWEERMNTPLDELLEKIADKKSPKIKLLLNLFYAGAVAYCEAKDKQVDFNSSDVSNWISELGIKKAGDLIKESLSTVTPKNLNPLQ